MYRAHPLQMTKNYADFAVRQMKHLVPWHSSRWDTLPSPLPRLVIVTSCNLACCTLRLIRQVQSVFACPSPPSSVQPPHQNVETDERADDKPMAEPSGPTPTPTVEVCQVTTTPVDRVWGEVAAVGLFDNCVLFFVSWLYRDVPALPSAWKQYCEANSGRMRSNTTPWHGDSQFLPLRDNPKHHSAQEANSRSDSNYHPHWAQLHDFIRRPPPKRKKGRPVDGKPAVRSAEPSPWQGMAISATPCFGSGYLLNRHPLLLRQIIVPAIQSRGTNIAGTLHLQSCRNLRRFAAS